MARAEMALPELPTVDNGPEKNLVTPNSQTLEVSHRDSLLQRFRQMRGKAVEIATRVLSPTPSFEPAFAVGSLETRDDQGRDLLPFTDQYHGQQPIPMSINGFPAHLRRRGVVAADGKVYEVPADPLWRRKRRNSLSDRHKMRLRDIPVWFTESLTLIPPFVEGVEKKAERVTKRPGGLPILDRFTRWPNFGRVVDALVQEHNEIVLTERELRGVKRREAIRGIAERQGVHLARIGFVNLIKDIAYVGRVMSAIVSIAKNAPEEALINIPLAFVDAAYTAAFLGALAIPVPVVNVLAAAAVFVADFLTNMWVNKSMDRRNKEANDRMIPKIHRIVRTAGVDDSRPAIYAQALKVMGRKIGRDENKANAFDQLQQIEAELDPRNVGNPLNAALYAGYEPYIKELRALGEAIDVLHARNAYDLVHHRFNIGARMPIIGAIARRKSDMRSLKWWFEHIDDIINDKFEEEHREAAELHGLVTAVKRRFPGYL